MPNVITRRQSFGRFIALSSLPLVSSRAMGQVPSIWGMSCPAGSTQKVTITNEFPTASFSINILGSGISGVVPVQRLKITVECTFTVPPPPPPPPPKPPPKLEIWDPFDYTVAVLTGDQVAGYQAGSYYLAVSLPTFVTLASTQPQLSAWAITSDGTQQTANFGLVRDGNGFRFANPSAVDYWSATSAAGAQYGGWQVSGVSGTSLTTGSGRYGVAQTLGPIVVNAFSDTVTVTPPVTRGTNVLKS